VASLDRTKELRLRGVALITIVLGVELDVFGLMYERLASFMIENLDVRIACTILEAGCGSGQLTLPFVRKLEQIKKDFRYIAYDLFAGPYEGDLRDFNRMVREERLQRFIMTIKGRVQSMGIIEDGSVDLIISNELFPDLNRTSLGKTLHEFYRILKPNGQMAHGALNPVSENESQALLIESNAYSRETTQPRPEWFSPYSDEVAVLMHQAGFKNIIVKYFETKVKLDYGKATEQLKKWNIDPAFIEKRGDDIKRFGLELPMEHVTFCKK
jgi:ubiquinone/menaquinone biosynthesis C-methylase UbiE